MVLPDPSGGHDQAARVERRQAADERAVHARGRVDEIDVFNGRSRDRWQNLSWTARRPHLDGAVGDARQWLALARLERIHGRRVALDHDVGADDQAVEHDHRTVAAQLWRDGTAHRVGEVARSIEVRRRRVAHGAGHDDGLGSGEEQVVGKGGFLDRVSALHDDRPIDLRSPQLFVEHAGDRKHLAEVHVRRGHEAPVDDLDVRDARDVWRESQDRGAVEQRYVAAGACVWSGGDRPAGEDNRGPRHLRN